jgi:hypothetical protein
VGILVCSTQEDPDSGLTPSEMISRRKTIEDVMMLLITLAEAFQIIFALIEIVVGFRSYKTIHPQPVESNFEVNHIVNVMNPMETEPILKKNLDHPESNDSNGEPYTIKEQIRSNDDVSKDPDGLSKQEPLPNKSRGTTIYTFDQLGTNTPSDVNPNNQASQGNSDPQLKLNDNPVPRKPNIIAPEPVQTFVGPNSKSKLDYGSKENLNEGTGEQSNLFRQMPYQNFDSTIQQDNQNLIEKDEPRDLFGANPRNNDRKTTKKFY